MKESDVEELVQAALAWVDANPNTSMAWNEICSRLELSVNKFRPKLPRVGNVKMFNSNEPGHDRYVFVDAIEFTDEVRRACADAGIEWEETT